MTASATSQLSPRDRARARLAHAVRHEQALFVLAAGAIGLHIADDNFFQPEPGTFAADHLVSGLLPLTLVLGAGAALLAGRLRAGGRAAVALLLGLFGVIGGIEAAYYAHAGALSGDDYSGILSALGGFLLLGSGVLMLVAHAPQGRPPPPSLPAAQPDRRRGARLRLPVPLSGRARLCRHTHRRRRRRDPETRRRRPRTSRSRQATVSASRAGSSPRGTARP